MKKCLGLTLLIFVLTLSACSDGTIDSVSMGLTSNGLTVDSPAQGLLKVTKVPDSILVSGTCEKDLTGIELTYDESTYFNLAGLALESTMGCSATGTYTARIPVSELSGLIPEKILESEVVVFSLRGVTQRSTTPLVPLFLKPLPVEDVTVPLAPELFGTVLDANKVYLSWNAVAGATYLVQQKVGEEWSTVSGPTPLPTNAISYTLSDVSAGVPLFYRVQALVQKFTVNSNVVTVEAMDALILSAASVTGASVTLHWNHPLGVVSYQVFRKKIDPTEESWELCLTIEDPLITSATLNTCNLDPRSIYRLKVKAWNNSGQIISNLQEAKTQFLGELNPGFNGNGRQIIVNEDSHSFDAVTALAFDPLGWMHIVGRMSLGTSDLDGYYRRYDLLGNLNFSTPSGLLGVRDNNTSLALHRKSSSEMEWVIGGWGGAKNSLGKLKTDGAWAKEFWKNTSGDLIAETEGRVLKEVSGRNSKSMRTLVDPGALIEDPSDDLIYSCETGVALGSLQGANSDNDRLFVYRYRADGTADDTWGVAGVQKIYISSLKLLRMADCLLDSEHRLLVLGSHYEGGVRSIILFRLTTNGANDVTFGEPNGSSMRTGFVRWNDPLESYGNEEPVKLLGYRKTKESAVQPLVLGNLVKDLDIDNPTLSRAPLLLLFQANGEGVDNQFGLDFNSDTIPDGYWTTLNILDGLLYLNWNHPAALTSGVFDDFVSASSLSNDLYLVGWTDRGSSRGKDMALWKFNMNTQTLDNTFGVDGLFLDHDAVGGGYASATDMALDVGINPINHLIYIVGSSQKSLSDYEGVLWNFH